MCGVRKAFRCAILIPFDWMTVDSSDSANILDLSSSSREVLCRQSWWQWRSFWKFECSSTIMLKEWPGGFVGLFNVRNVSNGCHLLVLSARFLLCSTSVLAALPLLRTVEDIGHCVQFAFLPLVLHFRVVLCVRRIWWWIISFQNPVGGSRKQPYNEFFVKCLECGFWLPPANTILPMGKLATTPTSCGMIEIMAHATLERSAYIECISSCWRH